MQRLTHWKRRWCWETLQAGGEGDDRGWDGWMVSPTQWTWVWANSGSWWWTGRPGMLRSMGSQRVGHNWTTELNWNIQNISIPKDSRTKYLSYTLLQIFKFRILPLRLHLLPSKTYALEKEMATYSSVLAWRIPGTGEPDGLPSMGSHRVRHDWSDLAAAAAAKHMPIGKCIAVQLKRPKYISISCEIQSGVVYQMYGFLLELRIQADKGTFTLNKYYLHLCTRKWFNSSPVMEGAVSYIVE